MTTESHDELRRVRLERAKAAYRRTVSTVSRDEDPGAEDPATDRLTRERPPHWQPNLYKRPDS